MTTLLLTGEITPKAAAHFARELEALTPADAPVTVDLSEAELLNATATATLVRAIRDVASRLSSIHVIEPPQVLAHGLYRVGALGGSSTIHLISPRQELGSSS